MGWGLAPFSTPSSGREGAQRSAAGPGKLLLRGACRRVCKSTARSCRHCTCFSFPIPISNPTRAWLHVAVHYALGMALRDEAQDVAHQARDVPLAVRAALHALEKCAAAGVPCTGTGRGWGACCPRCGGRQQLWRQALCLAQHGVWSTRGVQRRIRMCAAHPSQSSMTRWIFSSSSYACHLGAVSGVVRWGVVWGGWGGMGEPGESSKA